MKHPVIAIALPLLAVTAATAEEQLHKEITVEREIVPELRAASRLNLYPRPIVFKPGEATLQLSDYLETGEIDPLIAPLEPAQTAPAAPPTPWRGYLDLGYFPLKKADLSAGYAIVQTDATRLNLWGQASNTDYKGKPFPGSQKERFRNFDATVGLSFSHRFGTAGTLSASTAYSYDDFTRPLPDQIIGIPYIEPGDNERCQGVNRLTVGLDWKGSAPRDITYSAGASFGLMDFNDGTTVSVHDYGIDAYLKPVGERDFALRLGFAKRFGDSSVGADFTGDIVRYTRFRSHFADFTSGSDDDESVDAPGKTFGLFDLTPYYRYAAGIISLKAGARLGFSVNSGRVVDIAPDVLFAVNPASGFGGWLRLGGGKQLNTLASLFEITRYVVPFEAPRPSNIPFTGDLGLRFGPFRGASLTLQLSYAMADARPMPFSTRYGVVFRGEDLRSWRAKVDLNWAFRSWLALRAGYQATLGSNRDQTWIDCYDRARHIISAAVTVRPIAPLSIDLSYSLRLDRSMGYIPDSSGESVFDDNLGNESLLDLGVTYRVSAPFSVFLRGENLLDCRSRIVTDIPREGISGLVGITWKF